MKRLLTVILVSMFLCGCTGGEDPLQSAVSLRERLLVSSCSFTAEVTADFGDALYTFSLGCTGDADGSLKFIVLAPETIASISGHISAGKGYLTFDDEVLAFPLLAEGELSPVSAPWILMKALRGGYLSSGGKEGELIRITLFDSYEEDALQLELWLDDRGIPVEAEFCWQGRKVLSMHVKDFVIV